MTEGEQIHLMMKGLITEMSIEEQAKVHEAADELRNVITKHGDNGAIAFSLVGAEMAAKP